ncbi:hypothetical protein D3C76_1784320 [compost metagenome]
MNHITHVRFVYAHAERIRSDHDPDVVIEERLLALLPLFIGQARMVASHKDTTVAEPLV